MGASGWHHVVGYRDDVRATFAELQETVLAEGDCYRGIDDENTYATMADLAEARDTEEFWEEGTHSILDMVEVGDAARADEVGVVRVLRADEVSACFGADQPTAADFERFTAAEWDLGGWQGRVTTLYRAGRPDALAFWGISGD